MLFTFKSAPSADLIMHGNNGKEILALLGKCPDDARGIITVEQLPAAISTLQRAIEADKANMPEQDEAASSENAPDAEPQVCLAQRAVPFIEMLKRAEKAGEPVVWGV